MPDAEYRAHPALAQSGAKTLLDSPARFRWEQQNPHPTTDAQQVGILTHALILGQEHNFVPKTWDARTKAGKEEAQAVLDAGGAVISPDDWDTAHAIAGAVANHPTARGMFTDGDAEVSLFATCPITGVEVKGRADWLTANGIVDLKTTRDASPKGFAKSVAQYEYALQAAWYLNLAELNNIHMTINDFVFVAVEKTPPYLIGVYRLDYDALNYARLLMEEAREIYRDCSAIDIWPDWINCADGVETLSLPGWYYKQGLPL